MGNHTVKAGKKAGKNEIITVLDIGTSKITCIIAEIFETAAAQTVGKNEFQAPPKINVLGLGFRRSEGIRGGVIINMDQAEQAIRIAVDHAEQAAGITVTDVIVAITAGRQKSENFQASTPLRSNQVEEKHIGRVLSAAWKYAGREERAVLHAMPLDFHIDDEADISNPRGMMGDQLSVDVHSVTADYTPLQNFGLCIERCYLTPIMFVAGSYASGLASVLPEEAQLGVSCIDLGAGTTSLSVFSEGKFIHSDVLAIGGHNVTIDIARDLQTTLAQAERMKTLYGNVYPARSDDMEIITYPLIGNTARDPLMAQISKGDLAKVIRPRVQETLGTLRSRMDEADYMFYASKRVVLSGGGSLLTGMGQMVSEMFGGNVRIAQSPAIAGLPDTAMTPAFCAVTGLLLYPRQRQEEISRDYETDLIGGNKEGYFGRMGQWIRNSF